MTATDHALELVHAAARAASDKLASNIIAFDVSEQLAITDAFLLASATNDRQVKAIVDEIEDKLREIGAKPIRREGERDGRWVLIDYGDDRRARAARGGAAVLRPRAAVARLPGDRAARRRRVARARRRRPSRRTAAAPGPAPARPDRLERRGPGPGPADVAARRHRPRPGGRGGAVARRAAARSRCGPATCARARRDRGVRRGGDRPRRRRPTPGCGSTTWASAPGLTLAEFAETFPEEYARLGGAATSTGGGARRGDDAEVRGPDGAGAARAASTSLAPGETGVVVSHGACLKVGADRRCSAGRWRADAAILRGMDNCGWACSPSTARGRLRLTSYNETAHPGSCRRGDPDFASDAPVG